MLNGGIKQENKEKKKKIKKVKKRKMVFLAEERVVKSVSEGEERDKGGK